MNVMIIALITLGVIGLLAAIILYFVSQKFKIEEDPRIDLVSETLPGANCGGCGFPGCHGFAAACVEATNLDNLFCPVGGNECMEKVGEILGMEVKKVEPMIATLHCNGTCNNRPKTTTYDGSPSCRIVHSLYTGETECFYGCLGYGDCQAACQFGALHIDPETGIPVIDEDKCTACYACVKACPKSIIEMRKRGPKNRRIYVACSNKDKGGIARKACTAACIGCMKCVKECKFDAITVVDNCAYIDFTKCKLCRKCAAACPTGAIHEINFPPRAVANPAPAKKMAADLNANKNDVISKPTEKATTTPVAPVIVEEKTAKATTPTQEITQQTKPHNVNEPKTLEDKEPIIIDNKPKEEVNKVETPIQHDEPKAVEPIADNHAIIEDVSPVITEETPTTEEKNIIESIVEDNIIESNTVVEETTEFANEEPKAQLPTEEIAETTLVSEDITEVNAVVEPIEANTAPIVEANVEANTEAILEPKVEKAAEPIVETPKETISDDSQTSTIEQQPEEALNTTSPTENNDDGALNIDDIVNRILRESNYTVQEENSFILTEENSKNEPEIDIEALIQRKQEETVIDEIFLNPTKPETPPKVETQEETEPNNKPQQLELL